MSRDRLGKTMTFDPQPLTHHVNTTQVRFAQDKTWLLILVSSFLCESERLIVVFSGVDEVVGSYNPRLTQNSNIVY